MTMQRNKLHIPSVTTEQMREIDRLMIEEYGIELLQMMENAGRNLAELARRLLGGSVMGKRIIVAAGKGNNGGGGMVAARHLHNWGAEVVVLLQSDALSGVPKTQMQILTHFPLEIKVGFDVQDLPDVHHCDLILDVIIGYGLSGKPRGVVSNLIRDINASLAAVISLDVPSGMDFTTGRVYEPCIRAKATMTLALPKTGLLRPEAKIVIGDLYLADISVPISLYVR
jgi:NAD(P)H-hydrate epimerase